MALALTYQMFSKVLSWIVLRARSDTIKEIEILVLRRQTLWVPEIVFVAVDLPLRDRRRPGMIRRWHCG
jgi:hypothetical protein